MRAQPSQSEIPPYSLMDCFLNALMGTRSCWTMKICEFTGKVLLLVLLFVVVVVVVFIFIGSNSNSDSGSISPLLLLYYNCSLIVL